MTNFPYIHLERELFVEKKELAEIVIRDINTEIALQEEAIAGLRASMAERRFVNSTLEKYLVEEESGDAYRKDQIKTLNDLLRASTNIRKKDADFLAWTEEFVRSFDENESEQCGAFAKWFLRDYLTRNVIQILRRRLDTLKDDHKDYERSKKGFGSWKKDESGDVLNNVVLLNKKAIEHDERSIKENKAKIKELQDLKQRIENGLLARTEKKEEEDTKYVSKKTEVAV